MKKILILSNGITGVVFFRMELLKKLLEDSFQITISTPDSNKNKYVKMIEELGIVHSTAPLNRRGINPIEDLKLFIYYRNILSYLKPDIILTYTIKPNIYGNIAANLAKTPAITNITGIGYSLSESNYKFFYKKLYKFALLKTRKVFFQNSSNKEFFCKNNLVSEIKTQLIPGSGVNLQKFQPQYKTTIDNKIRFLFIGRLMKEKGIEELFEATQNITKKYPDTIFQIVGGMEEEKYISYFQKNENIEFLGRSEDVRVQIREVDCIINPSYHEGMSNVLQEAAAMGKPLLASNVPGCREIVEDGKNGFLFEVKNATDLQNKIVKFKELSVEKNSRQKVEKEFDRKIVVEEYMNAINSVMNAE